MRLSTAVALIVITACALVVVPEPSSAQDPPDTIKAQPTCPPPPAVPFVMDAPAVEWIGTRISAGGGVFFLRGNERITASEAFYDLAANKGVMKNVTFTTCSRAKPDYRLEAEEVTLLPNSKLHARNVVIFLGKVRVLALPSIRLRVGGNAASTSMFPKPGFDKRDGFSLEQELRLTDTNRSRTNLAIRLTTEHSIQGSLDTEYGLDGNLVWFPGRFMRYDSLRNQALHMPRPPVGEPRDPQAFRPLNPARLKAYARATTRQRTFDIKNSGLVVDREPEVGLGYIGRQLNLAREPLDPRIEIYPEVVASWGRYKEIPGMSGFTTRYNVAGVGALNFIPLGPTTTLQPAFSYGYSKYDNGDTYRETAWALDASHLFPNSSFVSLRYIKRSSSGETPFEFDDLDVPREYQGAFQARMKNHVVGLVVSYDATRDYLYEWEAFYGVDTDCLATWFRWNNRLKRFVFDVSFFDF